MKKTKIPQQPPSLSRFILGKYGKTLAQCITENDQNTLQSAREEISRIESAHSEWAKNNPVEFEAQQKKREQSNKRRRENKANKKTEKGDKKRKEGSDSEDEDDLDVVLGRINSNEMDQLTLALDMYFLIQEQQEKYIADLHERATIIEKDLIQVESNFKKQKGVQKQLNKKIKKIAKKIEVLEHDDSSSGEESNASDL